MSQGRKKKKERLKKKTTNRESYLKLFSSLDNLECQATTQNNHKHLEIHCLIFSFKKVLTITAKKPTWNDIPSCNLIHFQRGNN